MRLCSYRGFVELKKKTFFLRGLRFKLQEIWNGIFFNHELCTIWWHIKSESFSFGFGYRIHNLSFNLLTIETLTNTYNWNEKVFKSYGGYGYNQQNGSRNYIIQRAIWRSCNWIACCLWKVYFTFCHRIPQFNLSK